MASNLEKILNKIKSDKDTKLLPENIRYGTTILGVRGSLKPVQIDGNDVGLALYVQDNTPEVTQGIWLHTTKTYNHIYMENERHTTEHSMIYSNDTTDYGDNSNIIRGYTVPTDLMNCSYCQKGNTAHFFGYWNSDSTKNINTLTCQHYKYDFDNNVWTKLTDCPTPQGGGGCEWINDDTIYIIGTRHNTYYNYMYKYTISTDTWERLDDITVSNYASGYFITSCHNTDNNNFIYFVQRQYIYSYNISTSTIEFLRYNVRNNTETIANTNADVAAGLVYHDGCIIMNYLKNYYNLSKYNVTTNAVSSVGSSQKDTYSPDERSKMVLVGTRLFFMYANRGGYYNIGGTGARITSSGSTFSSYLLTHNYPILYFTSSAYDILFQPYGTTSYTQCRALILHDKTYEFEDNTVIIYTSDGTQGNYATELYRNEKVLNGVMKQKFNDVNFYDAEQDKIIKNIETYYGNGTNLVQIK